MIAMIFFSALAALLVYLAGRGDQARDPRLTILALGLLAVFPLLWLLLPKWEWLPASEPASGMAAAVETGVDWMEVLGWLWAVAFMIAVARLALAARGISRWRKIARKVGMEDGVEVLVLQGLKGPVAAGVIRPVVFVPAAWESWSDETRRIVLAHEFAHHRRRDPLWRWVAEIACAVNIYNPLVLWIARRLALQCEHACDAEVLGAGIPANKYARLLCDFAEFRAPAGPVLAMAVGPTLEARVRRLMVRPAGKQGSTGVMVLIGMAIAFAGTLASVGRAVKPEGAVTRQEVETRLAADAFPGNGEGDARGGDEGPQFATPP